MSHQLIIGKIFGVAKNELISKVGLIRAYGRDLQPNFDKLDILDSKFTQLLFELQVNQAF
jgi:hypothetical protein